MFSFHTVITMAPVLSPSTKSHLFRSFFMIREYILETSRFCRTLAFKVTTSLSDFLSRISFMDISQHRSGSFHWNERFFTLETLENLFILYSTWSVYFLMLGLTLVSVTGILHSSFSFTWSLLSVLKQTTLIWSCPCWNLKSKYLFHLGLAGILTGETSWMYPWISLYDTSFWSLLEAIVQDAKSMYFL